MSLLAEIGCDVMLINFCFLSLLIITIIHGVACVIVIVFCFLFSFWSETDGNGRSLSVILIPHPLDWACSSLFAYKSIQTNHTNVHCSLMQLHVNLHVVMCPKLALLAHLHILNLSISFLNHQPINPFTCGEKLN